VNVRLRQQVRAHTQHRFGRVAETRSDDMHRDTVRERQCRVRVSQDVQRSGRQPGRLAMAQERLAQPLRVDRAAELVTEDEVTVGLVEDALQLVRLYAERESPKFEREAPHCSRGLRGVTPQVASSG
jgi:hypothetical protein